MELGGNRAHGGFDAMFADGDAPEVCQTSDQPDGAVATHPQITHVIEKNYAGAGAGVVGWAEQGPDEYIAPAGLVDNGTA